MLANYGNSIMSVLGIQATAITIDAYAQSPLDDSCYMENTMVLSEILLWSC